MYELYEAISELLCAQTTAQKVDRAKDVRAAFDVVKARLEELNRKVDALQQENASLKKDASRIDWLESCNESHGFCDTGWGEYRYYSYVADEFPSVRQVLDTAMQANRE